MNNTETTKPSPVEVWLRHGNLQMTCFVVREDETTENLEVDSLSMRGAQREMTGYFLKQGYEPVGRWKVEHNDTAMQAEETVRVFRLANK